MDNAQTMELAALSSEEMESTEGALWANVIGGLAGMYGGGYGYLASGGTSPSGFLASAGGGFLGGAIVPARGISSAAKIFTTTFVGSGSANYIQSNTHF